LDPFSGKQHILYLQRKRRRRLLSVHIGAILDA
jgi:hypothetical protein